MEIFEPQEKREFETVLPLVNIVFLLLIFFMLAGAFTKPDLFTIVMPEANIDNDAERDQMTIAMNGLKEFAIEKTPYSQAELIEMIQTEVTNDHELVVQLKADKNVKSQDLIEIMEALGSTGLKSIRLLTVLESTRDQSAENADSK